MKLNDYFKKFEGNISLNPTRTNKIESALSNWERNFENDDKIGGDFLSFYPQGSYSTNTGIKPKSKEEFDVDVVLSLDINNGEEPRDILNLIAERIRSHKEFEDKVKTKNRCVRIDYEGDFHVDIVPAYPHNEVIKIPSRRENDWVETNPAGFTDWCNDINSNSDRYFSKVVKILKHWRDENVGKETAPKSILLTTLIGHSIVKKTSIAETLVNSLDELINKLDEVINNDVVFVDNPSFEGENLARDWDKEKANRFTRKLKRLKDDCKKALDEQDKEKSIEKWRDIFGGKFPSELGEAKSMARKVSNGTILVNSQGVLNQEVGAKVKEHRFYGRGSK